MAKERPKAKHKGLYRRGTVWWIRYAGLDGKIRFESSGTKTFKEAQVLLNKRKTEVSEGKDPIITRKIKPHTFRELGEHYVIWAERQKSYRRKKGIVKILTKEWCNLPLRHFNTRIVEEYQTKVITEVVITKDGKEHHKAPATANRHLACLKHMFTKAVEWEMVEEEALKKVRRVKLLPENNRRLRYLSKEESTALVDACKPHLRPIVVTALNTGMRKEEILSLEWERHIDLRNGFILLDITKNGDRREVPINQTLRKTLQSLVRHIASPYVFTDARGRRFANVVRSFKSACKKAGIKDFRFHDLRHTFASRLVMAGVDITTIKELLGHKTLTMTLRYAHLAPSHKVKAVEMLDDSLSQTPTIQKLYNLGGAK